MGTVVAWAIPAWLLLIYLNRFIRAVSGFLFPPDGRPNPLPILSPSAPAFASAIGRDLSGLAGAALVAAACLGFGIPGARFAGRGRQPATTAALALGAGLLGSALFGLGLAGLLRAPVLALLVAGGAFLAYRLARRPARRRDSREAGTGRPLFVAVMAFSAAGLALSALAPEIEVDSLHYHLARSSAWASTGRIAPANWAFPHELNALYECLMVPALAVGGEAGARLLNPLSAVLVAVALAGFPGGTPGLMAGALWLSGLGLGAAANTSKNDIVLALFGFMAFSAVTGGGDRRGRPFLGGVFAGLALAVKLTGGVVAVAAFTALLARPGRRLARSALFLAGSLGAVAPWLLKDWLNTGNPVFPLMPQLLGGGLTPIEVETMEKEVRSYLAIGYSGWTGLLSAPWTLAAGYSATVLPALALPAAVILGVRSLAGSRWVAASLAAFVLWLSGPPQFRFLIQALPILCGMAALGFAAAGRFGGLASRLPALLGLLAAAEAGLSWLDPGADRVARTMVATGVSSPGDLLAARLPAYAQTAGWAAANLPPGSRILLYGELRAFPLERRALVPWYGRPVPFLEMARESPDRRRLSARLRQLSATHVLVNRTHAMYRRAFLERLDPGERAMGLWAGWWRDHARLSYEPPVISAWTGSYSLYELDRRGGKPGPEPLLLPGLEAWLNRPEELALAGRTAEARESFDRVRRVAGNLAVVDLAEAFIFEGSLSRAGARALLERARASGLRSVSLLVKLAKYAGEDGDRKRELELLSEAAKLDPAFRP
jgi:hypothetical protein